MLLSGIGPAIAWRKATAANLRRNFLWPIAAGAFTLVALVTLGVTESLPAVIMFVVGAFTIGAIVQELWRGAAARRAIAGENPAVAVLTLVQRNRRRYGGYTVHVGMAVLFIGVAASSAFQQARDVQLSPGDRASVAGYDIRYVRSTARIAQRDGELEKISFGAVLDVRKDGKRVTMLRPERGYYPSMDRAGFGPLGRFFEGEATSEIGMKAGLTRDLWTAMSPDIGKLRPIIDRGDDAFAKAEGKIPPAMEAALLGQAITGLVDRYRESPPPATFRLIGSPLVAWIWIGGLIVFAGGLIAMWPARTPVRRESARLSPRGSRASSAAPSPPTPPDARVDVLAPLIVIVLLAVVVLVVSAPLRRGAAAREHEHDELERADLEAARDAKYREIRDAELDLRTGKLSEADWRATDRELRAEAIAILRRLDALGEPSGDRPAPDRGALPSRHGAHPVDRPGDHLGRPDLPGAHALGQGRRAVGRLRRGHRSGPARRRLARRAQPEPLDGGLRDRLHGQHDHPAQVALGLRTVRASPGSVAPTGRTGV